MRQKSKIAFINKQTSKTKKKGIPKRKVEKGYLLSLLKSKFPDRVFTLKEAGKYKVSSQLLSYYVKQDKLKRISYGVYAFKDSLSFDFHSLLKEKLACIPQGIVGLESALKIYGLTDENPDVFHLIVPLSNVPKRKIADVKFYRMKDNIYKKHTINISGLPVSSLERTIIDLLRFGYSVSFVSSVIEDSKKKTIPIPIGKVRKLAPLYRVKGKVSRLMELL